jgi:hypothetical protein
MNPKSVMCATGHWLRIITRLSGYVFIVIDIISVIYIRKQHFRIFIRIRNSTFDLDFV